MNINIVTIVGNLVDDPQSGNAESIAIANMRLAAHVEWQKEGEEEPTKHTDFVDVEVFGVMAENCLGSLHKGDRVIVVGPLRYDEWQADDGSKKSKLKVKAKAIGSSLEFAKKS
jgi:single-strand DNA-binding protein